MTKDDRETLRQLGDARVKRADGRLIGKRRRALCPDCGIKYAVKLDGRMQFHKPCREPESELPAVPSHRVIKVPLRRQLADAHERLEQVREWCDRQLAENATEWQGTVRNPSGNSEWVRGRIANENSVLRRVLELLSPQTSSEGRG